MENTEFKLCNVIDKISPILVCNRIVGTKTNKNDRSGEKYLATSELNPDLLKKLESGVKYKVTAKIDGTCCFVKNGVINKRRDIKPGRDIPDTWFKTGGENTSEHLIGFMPLEKGDKWHLDCYLKDPDKKTIDTDHVNVIDFNSAGNKLEYKVVRTSTLEGNSVEVIGPKFQDNPHKLKMHCVVRHGLIELRDFPDLYKHTTKYANDKNNKEVLLEIKNWFNESAQGQYIEGVVLHLEDGSMYKLHRHHLDLEWIASKNKPLHDIPI